MQNKHISLVNGNFRDAIFSTDRGLSYGDGVFRTLKVVNGFPEHWPLHYQMLAANCTAVGIVCPRADMFISDFEQLFFPEESAIAKIIVTRGGGDRGYAMPAIVNPTRILIKSNLPVYPRQYFEEGVQMYLCQTRLALQPKLAGIKHLNRLENVLARMEWHDVRFAEGLMLDMKGHVIEGVSSNIFARYGDTLITPKLTQCGVAGVTRQRILSLAKTLSLKTKIASLDLNKLLTSEELIICNSLYGAWQVRALASKTWAKQLLAENVRKALAV